MYVERPCARAVLSFACSLLHLGMLLSSVLLPIVDSRVILRTTSSTGKGNTFGTTAHTIWAHGHALFFFGISFVLLVSLLPSLTKLTFLHVGKTTRCTAMACLLMQQEGSGRGNFITARAPACIHCQPITHRQRPSHQNPQADSTSYPNVRSVRLRMLPNTASQNKRKRYLNSQRN